MYLTNDDEKIFLNLVNKFGLNELGIQKAIEHFLSMPSFQDISESRLKNILIEKIGTKISITDSCNKEILTPLNPEKKQDILKNILKC